MDVMEIMDMEPSPRPFKCEWDGCAKCFNRKSDLQRHDRIHRDHRPYACHYEHCRKRFIQRSALTVHIRTHTGEKPHKCDNAGCGKRFADSSSLARHRRTHTGKRPYNCGHLGCAKSFCRKTAMVKHQRETHQQAMANSVDGGVWSGNVAIPTTLPSVPDYVTPLEGPYVLQSHSYPMNFGNVNNAQYMPPSYTDAPRVVTASRPVLSIPSYSSPTSVSNSIQASPASYYPMPPTSAISYDGRYYPSQQQQQTPVSFQAQNSPIMESQQMASATSSYPPSHQQAFSAESSPVAHSQIYQQHLGTPHSDQHSPAMAQQQRHLPPMSQQQQQRHYSSHPMSPVAGDRFAHEPSPPQSASPEPQLHHHRIDNMAPVKLDAAGGHVPYHYTDIKASWIQPAVAPIKQDWNLAFRPSFPGGDWDAKIYSAGTHVPLPSSRLDSLE